MREIIFRGKTKSGMWAHGSLSSLHTDINTPIIRALDDDYKVIPETVGQYIGLQDKGGITIYQGDICTLLRPDGSEKTGEIVYNHHRVGYELKCTESYYNFHSVIGDQCPNIKIIGNIHDSPELLKQ